MPCMRAALRRPWRPVVAPVLLALAACGGAGPDEPSQPPRAGQAAEPAGPIFVDRARETGLDFTHFNGMTGRRYLPEMMGPGAALADLDGDGDLDALLVQGRVLEPGKRPADAVYPPAAGMEPLRARLYRNELRETGTLAFRDVTAESGLVADGYGMGVAVGDVDGDGLPDVYVTNLGPNFLFRNLGGLRFADVTTAAGADDPRWSASASFFDADRDGDLDLYVANYVAFSTATNQECRYLTGALDYCGPLSYPPAGDRFLRNRGDGTFEDATAAAGMAGAVGAGLGVAAADFDGDGWTDLFVANDGMANFLWRNRGDGTFEELGLVSGAAFNTDGRPEAGMGVAVGDADGDGDEDVLVSHLGLETNTFYRSDGRGSFEDASAATGLGPPSWEVTGFGAGWLDVDHDGWLDLVVVDGAVRLLTDQHAAGDPLPLREPDQLYRNLGPGAEGAVRFAEVDAATAGPDLAFPAVSRGLALGDVDDDGDVDLLVADNAGPARLLLGEPGEDSPWAGARLVDAAGSDAIGARAELALPEGRTLVRRVRTDGSYLSASDPRVVFGLRGVPPGDPLAVTVHWPDGGTERFRLEPGTYRTLRSGEGTP